MYCRTLKIRNIKFRTFVLSLLLTFPLILNAENPYTPAESLQIKEACIDLGTRYAYYLDTNQPGMIASLFDDHGSFQGTTGKYSGRENINLAFSRRPKNRRTIHIVTNHIVDIQSRNMVEVISNFATYRTEEATGIASLKDQPVRVGRYTDECVRLEDEWLFQSRTMEEIFGVSR